MKQLDKQLSKKLKSYSALATSLIAAGATADAQVVYTDVTPDLTVSAGTYNLDLNNDGTADFQIIHQAGTFSYLAYNVVGMYMGAAMNAVDTATGGSGYAAVLASGIVVDATRNWADSAAANGGAGLLAVDVPGVGLQLGNWVGQNDKFLGLRFTSGGDTYYGWARLDVASDATSFTVNDYAYKNLPDNQIITGQTSSVGIAESAMDGGVEIFAAHDQIHVNIVKDIPVEGTITVRNVAGQVIRKMAVTSTSGIIDMTGEAAGIYMVTITQNTGAYTKRVALK